MTKYHIVFKNKVEDIYSTGKTYEAITPIEALAIWEQEYPSGIFAAMYIDNAQMSREHLETPVGDIKIN